MQRLVYVSAALLAGWFLTLGGGSAAEKPSDDPTAPVQAAADAFVKAFNAGDVDGVAKLFLDDGELVDEQGVVYRGQNELKELFAAYFGKYPGAELTVEAESIRLVGPVSIEEGARRISTKTGGAKAQLRYVAVRTKTDAGWKIASLREFPDHPAPTPSEHLQALAWLEGDWINEGSDAVVKISYRWSEDKNFLLGEYVAIEGDAVTMKTQQRIGWDPLAGKIRSWLFDSDGGFAEAAWTQIDDTFLIKTSAVNPDGKSGSATIHLVPQGKNRFSLKGTERIVGDSKEEDFELTVARVPPGAEAKKTAETKAADGKEPVGDPKAAVKAAPPPATAVPAVGAPPAAPIPAPAKPAPAAPAPAVPARAAPAPAAPAPAPAAPRAEAPASAAPAVAAEAPAAAAAAACSTVAVMRVCCRPARPFHRWALACRN